MITLGLFTGGSHQHSFIYALYGILQSYWSYTSFINCFLQAGWISVGTEWSVGWQSAERERSGERESQKNQNLPLRSRALVRIHRGSVIIKTCLETRHYTESTLCRIYRLRLRRWHSDLESRDRDWTRVLSRSRDHNTTSWSIKLFAFLSDIASIDV